MKLKIGKDLVNKEFVLVIPNQITMVFDFDFTYLKTIGQYGTKLINIDNKKIDCSYINSRVSFGQAFAIYSSSSFREYANSNYIYLNHSHIKNLVVFLIENVPFDINDYAYEDITRVKEVKIYANRFVITYKDDLGRTVPANGELVQVWQYYLKLRELINEITV